MGVCMPAVWHQTGTSILAGMGARRLVVLLCVVLIAAPFAVAVLLRDDRPRTVTTSTGQPSPSPSPSPSSTTPETAPEDATPSASTLTFSAVGDIGSGQQAQATLEGMAQARPDLHLALGDLSYAGTGSETKWC